MSFSSPAETADKSPILTPQSSAGSQASYASQNSRIDINGIRQIGVGNGLSSSRNDASLTDFPQQGVDALSQNSLDNWEPLGFTAIPLGSHTRKNSRFASAFAHREVSPVNRTIGIPSSSSIALRSASISTAVDDHGRQSPIGPQPKRSISGNLLAGTGWNLNQGFKDSLGNDQHSPVMAPLSTTGLRATIPSNIQSTPTTNVTDDLISPLALGPQSGPQAWSPSNQNAAGMWNMDSISGFADPFALGQQQQQQQRTQPARPSFQRTFTAGSNRSATAASNASGPFSGSGSIPIDETISPRASLRQRQPPAANRALSSINWSLDNNLIDPLRQASPMNSPPSPTAFQRSSFSMASGGQQDENQTAGAGNQLHRTTSRDSATSTSNFAFPVPWNTVPPNQYRSQSFSVATLGRDRLSMNRGLSKVWEDDVISDGYGSDGTDRPINEAASYTNIGESLHSPSFSTSTPFNGTSAGIVDLPDTRSMQQQRQQHMQLNSGVRRMSELAPSQLNMLQRGFAANGGLLSGIDHMLETQGAPDNIANLDVRPTSQRRCSEQAPPGHMNMLAGSSYMTEDPNSGALKGFWNDNNNTIATSYADRGSSYYQTPPISPISNMGPSGQYSGPRRSSFNHLPNMLQPLTVDPQLARRHSAANMSINQAPISPLGFASSLPRYGPEGMPFPISPTRDGFPIPLGNPCESDAFKPHVHSQHPNGLPPLSRSTAQPRRPDSPLYIVTFKCYRAGIYYIPDNSHIHVEVGDLVFVDADRGQDLGSVAAVNLDHEQAKIAKEWYDRQHLQWLMMFSRFWQGGNTVQPFLQPDRPLGVAFAMAPSNTHFQSSGRRRDTSLRPKYIKRVLKPEVPEGLRNKEALENKAKRLCQERVASRGMQMEILDAEYQWDSHKLTLYFYAGSYINFNDLVEDMFREYKTRIWMEAVNPAPFQNPANYPVNNPQPYIYRPLHAMTNSQECQKYTNNINAMADHVASFQRQSLMNATMLTHYPFAPTAAEMDVPYIDPYYAFVPPTTRQLQAQQQPQLQHQHQSMQGMQHNSLGIEREELASIFNTLQLN
ncbi:psp1 [Ascosphaera apis ARSEF 7405]|uniref:Psp1 n=1 Tax=Ascosphaera apis ARSEF 7405 TaxID=392613 RepID=A0A168DM83_9EURO|nr:psp1 [Ascosphaera apis ARSEF 7405]